MSEIIKKARESYEKNDFDSVVETLKDYVEEYPTDREAMALFQRSKGVQTFLDLGLSSKDLYSEDEKKMFNGVPEEGIFGFAEVLFLEHTAGVYLQDRSDEDKNKLIFGSLHRMISALGERLNDKSVLNSLLNRFYEILSFYGLAKDFYSHLAYIVDWKSKASENILMFLTEKAKTVSSIASDKEVYDAYTKDMAKPLCPYEDKPYLSGGKLVIVKIKSEEEKEFWKGYFAFEKKIREEEYESFRKIATDETHPLYGTHSIGEHIHNASMNAMLKGFATSADVAKMQVETRCPTSSKSESDFEDRIQSAELSFNTAKVNPIEQIKAFIMNLLGKIKR